MSTGYGECNGTFGELVQGVMNHQPFLITLPINLRSKAIFTAKKGSTVLGALNKKKAISACHQLLQILGIRSGGILSITSNIPTGKGMASSSADIVASLKAVADAFSVPLKPELISKIACNIEPSDGVMYDQVCSYDYIHGELIESLGSLPPMKLIGVDFGGQVDTISFNKIHKGYSQSEKTQLFNAYQSIKKGIESQNHSLIYKATTISASINERFLPKPFFHELNQLANIYHGGIVTAHSGTVLGLLLNDEIEEKDILEQVQHITKLVPFTLLLSNQTLERKDLFGSSVI